MKKKWLVDCWEQTVLQLSSIYRNQKRSLQYRCCVTLQVYRKIKEKNLFFFYRQQFTFLRVLHKTISVVKIGEI